MITAIIKLLRPHQWMKNLFVFLPLFFGGRLFDSSVWISCICACFSFCFAASGVYCLNDIVDVDSDRKHGEKCKRPVASGAIGKNMAYVIMVICWIVSFSLISLGCFCDEGLMLLALIIVLAYILLNIAYCLKLKQYCIVDVFIVALGFVLRVVLGGIVTHVELSQWIILMTFLLALFIAFAKRRDDVVQFENSGVELRNNIGHYNRAFLNQVLCIIASITMVCYIMYTVSAEVVDRIGNQYIYSTAIFVLAGLLRYLQITIVDQKSGSPTEILLKDRFILFCILIWILTFGIFLYC